MDVNITQGITTSVTEIVTLIGIGVTLIIGAINIGISVHRSRVEGITNKRTEWIYNVRSVASLILQYDSELYSDEHDLKNANRELLRNAYSLNMLLNIMGPFDAVVVDCLCDLLSTRKISINHNIDGDKYIASKRKLNLALQIYLKAEWNRVKWENKYFKWKYNEGRELGKILEKFSSENTYVQEIKEKYNTYKSNSLIRTRQFTEFIKMEAKG